MVRAFAMLLQEAERMDPVWAVVILGIPHDRLLRYTDYVTGWDIASVGELEIFQDLTLDRYYSVVRVILKIIDIATVTYKILADRGALPHIESFP